MTESTVTDLRKLFESKPLILFTELKVVASAVVTHAVVTEMVLVEKPPVQLTVSVERPVVKQQRREKPKALEVALPLPPQVPVANRVYMPPPQVATANQFYMPPPPDMPCQPPLPLIYAIDRLKEKARHDLACYTGNPYQLQTQEKHLPTGGLVGLVQETEDERRRKNLNGLHLEHYLPYHDRSFIQKLNPFSQPPVSSVAAERRLGAANIGKSVRVGPNVSIIDMIDGKPLPNLSKYIDREPMEPCYAPRKQPIDDLKSPVISLAINTNLK